MSLYFNLKYLILDKVGIFNNQHFTYKKIKNDRIYNSKT